MDTVQWLYTKQSEFSSTHMFRQFLSFFFYDLLLASSSYHLLIQAICQLLYTCSLTLKCLCTALIAGQPWGWRSGSGLTPSPPNPPSLINLSLLAGIWPAVSVARQGPLIHLPQSPCFLALTQSLTSTRCPEGLQDSQLELISWLDPSQSRGADCLSLLLA